MLELAGQSLVKHTMLELEQITGQAHNARLENYLGTIVTAFDPHYYKDLYSKDIFFNSDI